MIAQATLAPRRWLAVLFLGLGFAFASEGWILYAFLVSCCFFGIPELLLRTLWTPPPEGARSVGTRRPSWSKAPSAWPRV